MDNHDRPHHRDTFAPRYWTVLHPEDVPQAVSDVEYAARTAARHLGSDFKGVELVTANGRYMVAKDGVVKRTRILPDCILPVTDAWAKGFTDEPHNGAPCVPPGV